MENHRKYMGNHLNVEKTISENHGKISENLL